MRIRTVATWACAVILALTIGGQTWSADDATGGEVGILVGATKNDDTLDGRFGEANGPEFTVGLRGGSAFSPNWGWFIDWLYTDADTAPLFGGADIYTGRFALEYLFPSSADQRWFVDFGGGWTEADYTNPAVANIQYSFVSGGVGQRFPVGENVRFRWELRLDRSVDEKGIGGKDITRAYALAGLQWGPGGKATDTDGDGVIDRRDDCPDTPRGAVVDTRGCPSDADGDGVFDGIDACPDTPAGWPVDDRGCPRDTDGDGVAEGEDACPGTPRGAVVDARGCPEDSDGDGVADGIDRCPDTPRGAKVDASGCPLDSDGDGVFDGIDRCPGTPTGVAVDATGCPADSDGDGVPDDRDACPGTPRGTAVDAKGCPQAKLFEEGKRKLVLEGVNFEVNRAVLTANARRVLDTVALSLLDWPSVRVEVGGYTDSTGADSYNAKLSKERAQAVVDYLVGKGVPASQLQAEGYGESGPIADNGTAEGRARNRRVELKRLD